MAVAARGVDIRQSGSKLVFRASLKDSGGARVTSGTTALYLYELQDDGTLKSYDFNDNTFKTTALTTETASMTHRLGNNGATSTGVWTYSLATLSGFTAGAVYLAVVSNSGASPVAQEREFQYGLVDGDLQVDSSGYGKLSAGTGTGQLDVTAGVAKSNLSQILGTVLTETIAGNLAGAFKRFFNIQAPTLTTAGIDQSGDNFARLGAPILADISHDIQSRLAASGYTAPDNTNIVSAANSAATAASAAISAASSAATSATNSGTVLARLGAFTGTGVNTLLGFLRAMFRSDLIAPSDLASGGTATSAADSLQAIAAAQPAAAAIASQTAAALAGAPITYTGPMQASGNAEVVLADDYHTATGRQLSWNFTGAADLTAAQSVKLYVPSIPGLTDANAVVCTVTNAGQATQTVTAQLSTAQTALLTQGNNAFYILAILSNGDKDTILRNGNIEGEARVS